MPSIVLLSFGMLLRRRKLTALLILVWAAALFRFELAVLLFFVVLFNAASFWGRWRSAMGSAIRHLLLSIRKSCHVSTAPLRHPY